MVVEKTNYVGKKKPDDMKEDTCSSCSYSPTLPYLSIPYLTIPYHTIPYLTIPYINEHYTISYHTKPNHSEPNIVWLVYCEVGNCKTGYKERKGEERRVKSEDILFNIKKKERKARKFKCNK